MNIKQKRKFYMCDYFLDGHFLKSEPIIGESLPQIGEEKLIQTKLGTDVHTKILDIEEVSEDEFRIFLNSSM